MAVGRLNKDKIPSTGSTSTRPSSPAIGDTHYNGTLGRLEIYTSQGWMALNAPAATPTSVTATDAGSGRAYNNGSASVAFTPATTGGLPTSYVVTSSPGSYTATGSSSPITVSGQQSSTQYTYTVVASNDYGTATTSSASAAVTATTVPQAPTFDSIVIGSTVLSLYLSVNDGGSEITQYTVTSNPGNITVSSSSLPIAVTGLTDGTPYTFTATATNANGTSAVSSPSNSATPTFVPLTVSYLVIAGGGGGGDQSLQAGGGGAGGYRTNVSGQSSGGGSNAENSLTLTSGTNYSVTVGAGGAIATNGTNSIFSTITSIGGGKGADEGNGSTSGGSGGAGSWGGGGSRNAGSSGTANQGYAGGSMTGGNFEPASPYSCGGGGGAGGVGANANKNNSVAGVGGVGVANNITGTSIYRAGGGGGGNRGDGTGGAGGNGGGGTGKVSAGTNNTGGGGGAGYSGGSGVVILRYPLSYTITLGAGLTGSTNTVGANKVTTITSGNGNISWA